jgi:GNAT superfamily N-acetyltransferase
LVAPLELSDAPEALKLSLAAGWNQTEADWRRVIALEPDGCWGLHRDGRLVATASTICYGDRLAWIGMVLTDPAFRGLGCARTLVCRCLEYLEQRKIQTVRLDATDAGKHLYQSLGFLDEYPVERWIRHPAPAVSPPPLAPFRLDTELDNRAFGADRSRLLMELAGLESAACAAGYAMGRPGAEAFYFGPCVSRTPDGAAGLLSWYISRHCRDKIFWDLIPHNVSTVALARKAGFERHRTLTRMRKTLRDAAPPHIEVLDEIYALAGFEFG